MKNTAYGNRSIWTSSVFVALVAGVVGFADPAPGFAAGKSTDVGHVGLGAAWQPLQIANAGYSANSGYVTARYWFSKKFGIDGGLGLGLPRTSSPTQFQMNISVTPMYALKRWGTSVFYADAQVIPAILTGGGTSFLMSFSGGIGIESALPGLDNIRWYAQLNPVSIDYYNPAGPGDSTVGLDFLGAVMPVSFGLHYYF